MVAVAALVLSIGLIAPTLVATSAEAAVPITVSNVSAQMANTAGYTGASPGGAANTTTSDCIRYGVNSGGTTGSASNSGGTNGTSPYANGSTKAVSGGTDTAWTGHGANGSGCPSTGSVDLNQQSSIGFRPVAPTNVMSGAVFNIGRMVHVNRPLTSGGNNWLQGDMNIKFNALDLTFQWQLNETPNSGGGNCCNDNVNFLNQIGAQTFTQGGLTYALIFIGFTEASGSNKDQCAPTTASANAVNNFSTVEGQVTYGCLYAVVQQVRPITVEKVATTPYGAPPTMPAFPFTSTSSLAGAPWGTGFSLTPGGTSSSVTRNYTVSENVTINETAPPAGWAFTSLVCKDGTGANIGTISGSSVTFTGDLTTATAAAAPIKCTYTNTYTPRATLTLVKQVTTVGQPAPVATVADWTLSATGQGAVAGQVVSGAGGTVTNRSVIAGSYVLAESPNNAGTTTGYEQNGDWSCNQNVTVTGGRITLAAGQNVTCTVKNVYRTGSLAVTKTVTSPAGGYTLGTAKAFTAHYVCTVGTRTVSGDLTVNPHATNGNAGTVATAANLPAGASCVVTETNAPTGSTDLANGSFVWGTPVVTSSPVTIPANGTASVNLTNPVTQNTGSLTITKTVVPTGGAPAAGFTNTTRTFDIGYRCTIGAAVTSSGTVSVPAGGAQTVTGIPSTSSCALSETQPTGADFVDASYRWTAPTLPQAVTVGVGTTVTAGVTNSFTRDLVNLTIAKVVAGAGYTAGDTFPIAYACGDTTGTVTIAGGANQTVRVPAGVACTVAEDTAHRPALTGGNVWTDPTYTGLTNGTITVAPGQTGTVTVRNATTIGFGKIAVAKAISGPADKVTPGTSFGITVACSAPAQGQSGNYSQVFTFTAPVGGAQTTPFLPVGASCTVTETAAPSGSAGLPDGSYAWAAPSYTGLTGGAVVVPTSTDPATVIVTNPVQRVRAPLAIAKVVRNQTGATPSAPFTGTWSCTYGTDPAVSGTWTVGAAGGAAQLAGLGEGVFVGSSCTVTEDDIAAVVPGDASYVWATQIPGAVTVSADGATATVTNTLTRTTGSLSVAKTVTGGVAGAAFANTPFAFEYTCTPASGPAISGTLDIAAGASAGATQTIPAGSTCVVTEKAARPAPVDPYRWGGVTLEVTGATGTAVTDGIRFVTPADGATVAVTATNEIEPRTGSVSVTKALTDPAGGFTGGNAAMFPLSLSCTPPGGGAATAQGTKNVAVGGTATWDDIPLGSTCAVTEQAPTGGLKDGSFAWAQPAYSHPDGVRIADAGTPTMTVTNGLTRVYAPIALTKVVADGGFTGVLDPAQTFRGSWTCTYDGATVAAGTWTGTGSTAGLPATLTETTGSLAEIPVSSTCSAEADTPGAPSADASFHWLEPQVTGSGPLATTGGTVTVTNTLARDVTRIQVVKTLDGATEGYAPAADFVGFPVGAVCALDPADLGNASATNRMTGTADVTAGAAAVTLIDSVPQGWTCRVTEGSVSGQLVDASYAWGTPTISEPEAFVPPAGGSTVTVTNPITRLTDGLVVTKAYQGIDDGVVRAGTTFAGTYTCDYATGTDRAAHFEGTWSVTGAGIATLSPEVVLPYGTACVATENPPSASALANVSWGWDDPSVTVVSDVSANGPAAVTVTNSVHRVYGALTVAKEYSGLEGALPEGLTVAGSWSCTLDGVAVPGAAGIWTLPAAGGQIQVDDAVPAGSSCTVTEDSLDDADLTDASYAWDAATFPDGASATVTAETTAVVTVVNSTHRVTGAFSITKDVVRAGLVPAGVPAGSLTYSGTYTCTYAGQTGQPQPWGPIPAGGTWTSSADIPVGSECAAVETAPERPHPTDDSYVWGGEHVSNPVTIVADGAPTITVTNTVNRLTSTFGVTKVVDGDMTGLPEGRNEYGFEWQCVAPDGASFPEQPGTFSIAAGVVWDGAGEVPQGSCCTVTEVKVPTPVDPSYHWSTTMATAGAEATPGDHLTFVLPPGGEGGVIVTATNTLTRTMGSYTVAKDSDPATGATVMPGQTVRYTVTVTPGAEGFVNDVVVTDSLASVLAGATLDDGSLAVSQGGATLVGDEIVWTLGRVAAGEPLTMTYSVTVAADAWGRTLKNVVTATGEEPPTDCTTCTTEHFTPKWTLKKTSDPESGSAVVAGDVITYTLTAHNISAQATLTGAVATDDLSGVAAYADLTTPLPTGLTRSGDTLTWAVPTLAPDESATISYRVTVKPGFDGVRLHNTAAPGPGGDCLTAVLARAADSLCETTHSTPKWHAAKTSDPAAGAAVEAGSSVTYTLTATNDGDVDVTRASVIDDLSAVLPHASLAGSLPDGLVQDGDTLVWTVPELAPGASTSVQYTVTVHDDARAVTIRNVITTDGPGGSCPEQCVVEHPVPGWTLSKTSDPASGSTVVAGDEITYTLTARNIGETLVHGAVATDDLSGVAQFADLGALPDGLVRDGDTLTWTIPDLEVGSSVTTSYTVTVKPGFDGVTLHNTATPGPGGECVPPTSSRAAVPECETTHETPKWHAAKTSDPAPGTAVQPGATVHYTLTVANDGAVPVTKAVVLDDLSGVLGHAALTEPLPEGLVRDGEKLAWTVPEVGVGESVSIGYDVVVNQDARAVTIRNVITTDGPGGSCPEQCVVEHPVPGWTLSKTSDPASGSAVVAGDVITYTLTARNIGETPVVGAVATDDLSGVSPFAELGDLPAGLTRDGDTLTWAIPDLAVGESVTGTYSVTVKAGFDGVTLHNTATPGPGGECVPATSSRAVAGACETTHDTPKWHAEKTSEPGSGAAVLPGATVRYTLTVVNDGVVPVTKAVVLDDLSGVLEHAALTEPLPEGLVRDGEKLTWTVPEVGVGESVSIGYDVVVNADARAVTIRNVITTDGPGGSCPEKCVVEHPVPGWTVTKTSDPASGSKVQAGDRIVYTLTATNLADQPLVGALGVDDLAKVVTHADLASLPDGVTRDGNTLTWAIPELAPGASVSVSYAVVVKKGVAGVTIENSVAPAGAPGGECVQSCTTTHHVPPAPPVVVPPLPPTGVELGTALPVGILTALLLGLGLVLMRRRPQRG